MPSCLLSLEERETQQYTSPLCCSTPPICTAVLLRKYWGWGHRKIPDFKPRVAICDDSRGRCNLEISRLIHKFCGVNEHAVDAQAAQLELALPAFARGKSVLLSITTSTSTIVPFVGTWADTGEAGNAKAEDKGKTKGAYDHVEFLHARAEFMATRKVRLSLRMQHGSVDLATARRSAAWWLTPIWRLCRRYV